MQLSETRTKRSFETSRSAFASNRFSASKRVMDPHETSYGDRRKKKELISVTNFVELWKCNAD